MGVCASRSPAVYPCDLGKPIWRKGQHLLGYGMCVCVGEAGGSLSDYVSFQGWPWVL